MTDVMQSVSTITQEELLNLVQLRPDPATLSSPVRAQLITHFKAQVMNPEFEVSVEDARYALTLVRTQRAVRMQTRKKKGSADTPSVPPVLSSAEL